MRVLALDFDGVISDSAPECFWVALRTYVDLHGDRGFGEALSALDARRRDRITELPLYLAFVDLMPLGNRAEDFGVALSLLVSGIAVRDQAEYDRERERLGRPFLEDFHERFYQRRDAFSDSDPEGWEALMGPYPAFVELLQERGGELTLVLATAKDRRSVRRLLERYGLGDRLPEERVLDKETGESKHVHLSELLRRTAADPAAVTFVDDKVNHLDSVASLGVRCALATWGYNGVRERELARQRGYLLCTLENAREQLFDRSQVGSPSAIPV